MPQRAMLCNRQHLPAKGTAAQPHCADMGELLAGIQLSRAWAWADIKSGPGDAEGMSHMYNTIQLTVVIYGKVRSAFNVGVN